MLEQMWQIENMLRKSRIYARIVFREMVFHRRVPYLQQSVPTIYNRIVPHRDPPGRIHESRSLSLECVYQNGDMGSEHLNDYCLLITREPDKCLTG